MDPAGALAGHGDRPERAKFDRIRLGDSLAVPGTYQGRMDAYLRYAEHAPFPDLSPGVAIMAAATCRSGRAATLSTTFYPRSSSHA